MIVFILVHVLGAISRLFNSGAFGGNGPLGDTNDFALAMNVVIPLGFYMGLTYTGIKRIGFWLATLLFVVANVATLSRGGFVGMAAVAFFMGMQSRKKAKAIVALMATVVLFFIFVPHTYKGEMESIQQDGTQKGTSRDRIELWEVAWRMFLDNPVLGVGQGNLKIMFEKYQYDDRGNSYWQQGMYGRAVHSVYFTLLAELGAVGTCIWLLMVRNFHIKYRFIKKQTLRDGVPSELRFAGSITLGLFAGLVGYLTSGMFLSAFYYPYFWHLSALITIVYILPQRSFRAVAGSVKKV
jgi:probable O-glycosylation ligase (exosortase A-associated)